MGPADDIIINKNIPQKSSGKGFLIIFFLLIIALAGCVRSLLLVYTYGNS